MAQLLQAFDATQWDPSQSAGQLPIGKHKVIIVDSEVKATKANDGGYLALTLEVIEGPSVGASGVTRLNLYSQNQKAVEIAHRELSALCHSVNVYNVQDSKQLHNIPFMVEVGNQKPTQEQEARRAAGEEVTLYTEVKKIFDVNGNAPGKKGAAPAQPAPSQPAPAAQPNFNVAPAEWSQPAQGQQPPAQAPAAAPATAPAWATPAQPAPAQAPTPAAPAWQAGAPAGGPAPWAAR